MKLLGGNKKWRVVLLFFILFFIWGISKKINLNDNKAVFSEEVLYQKNKNLMVQVKTEGVLDSLEKLPREESFSLVPVKHNFVSESSGFIFDVKNFYVLTVAHAIKKNMQYIVILNNNLQVKADLILLDKNYDLAVLKLPKNIEYDFPKINYTYSFVGEKVVSFGYHFNELRYQKTKVQANNIHLQKEGVNLENVLQLAGKIPAGFSGGPVFNYAGEIVGMNMAVSDNYILVIPSVYFLELSYKISNIAIKHYLK